MDEAGHDDPVCRKGTWGGTETDGSTGGVWPADLRWRWTALRLILPTGLFRLKDAQGEWDVFCVTLVKVVDGQQLDLHPTLQEEATIMFGHRPLPDGWLGQDAMLFYFQRRHHPEHKKSLGLTALACWTNGAYAPWPRKLMSMRTAVRSGPRI